MGSALTGSLNTDGTDRPIGGLSQTDVCCTSLKMRFNFLNLSFALCITPPFVIASPYLLLNLSPFSFCSPTTDVTYLMAVRTD